MPFGTKQNVVTQSFKGLRLDENKQQEHQMSTNFVFSKGSVGSLILIIQNVFHLKSFEKKIKTFSFSMVGLVCDE